MLFVVRLFVCFFVVCCLLLVDGLFLVVCGLWLVVGGWWLVVCGS